MAEQLEIEDFDTAKAVFEKLKDVPAERRKRLSFDALAQFATISQIPKRTICQDCFCLARR